MLDCRVQEGCLALVLHGNVKIEPIIAQVRCMTVSLQLYLHPS